MSARRPISLVLCALVGVLVVGVSVAGASKGVVGFFGGSGTASGLFSTPGGVAVNDASGSVYVVDSGNDRVQEFSAGGAFVRAWGLGVVSTGQDSGGTGTVQSVIVKGTSGTFTLTLAGQTTSAIAYDASDSVVEADLDALGTIGGVGGSVTVTGEGTGGSPYLVTFGGSLRGSAVALMTVNTSGLGIAVGTVLSCAAGPASATTKTFQWLRDGVAIEGATSSTYTTVAQDAGDVVQCQVFAINANAGSTQVSAARVVVSPAPAMVPPGAPAIIEKPTVATGALKVGGAGGATLTCTAGAWTGASTFSYQWYRNGVALSGNGANTSVYAVQSADLTTAAVFQCAVTATGAGGSVTLISANLATEPKPEAPVAPVATATATVPVLATVATTATGAPAFEVCNAVSLPQDVCKAGLAGESRGAMSTPEGVAVEQVTGNVYVTDQGNHRVDEFTPAGAFVRMFGREVNKTKKTSVCTQGEVEKESVICQSGASGAAAGEFGASIGYPAVDPGTGDVYVADPANSRVDVFEGDGVFVHAFGWGVANGAGEFQLCTSACQAGVASSSETNLGRFAAGSPTGVALDALGNAYVVDGGAPDYRVQKFASVAKENAPLAEFFASAQLTGTSGVTAPSDIAVEPTLGSVLVAREPSSPAEHLIYELGSGGALLGTYGEGAGLPASQGLTVGSSGGSAYLSTATNNRVFVLGTILAPTVTIEAATDPTTSEATLHGTVDPNETPPNGLETAWQFEYSTNQVEWTPLPVGKLAASTSPVAVTQTVTGLEGSTLYYVRLHANKEFAAGSATSPTSVQFTTSAAAPSVSGETVTKVAATSATFSAQINPQHLDTTYHFEYDTTPYTSGAMHGTSLPVPDQDIGEGSGEVPVSQESRSLRAGTTYHYRVLATNSVQTTDGPEHTFTTQAQGQGEALVLPDGRQWEMVSPPNKNGTLIVGMGAHEDGTLIQAAAGGGAFTWEATTGVGQEVAGNSAPNWSQIISTRGPDGWSSRDIAPRHQEPTRLTIGGSPEYTLFSADLSIGAVAPLDQTLLSPQATEQTLYLRETAGANYVPLVTAANVPPGTKIYNKVGIGYGLEFEGATPDLSHVVLLSNVAALTPNAPGGGVYEWVAGQLQLVSVLPDGEPAGAAYGAGSLSANRHAISDDGSRIIWNAAVNQNEPRLYMRDTRRGETLQLDPGRGVFQAASADGSRVFFTEGGSLYECAIIEAAAGDECDLSDLTLANGGEDPGVQGVVPGVSEDGSYVYLVARGVLSEAENEEHEQAEPGADNLYALHDTGAGWTTTFITRLSGEDGGDWSERFPSLTSRVSPNGRYFAFMSDRELTGYDNHDANSGAADDEVFLYDAEPGEGARRLICASCDPTGERPVGGAGVPGWTPFSIDQASYQSRYLSDSGRLFFNSSDALVPQDVDGTEDVYEYEPPGVGGCEASSVTFGVSSRGCVGLISSGRSSEESVFFDASESGGDVFFVTAAKLVSQDYDVSLDVYDAHECTAQSPCVSAPVSPPVCTTADACRTPAAPQPSVFGAPSSQTFSGAGNAAPVATPSVKVKVKVLTGAQKLAKALKACKQKPKEKRAQCEKQARKQYRASKAKKASTNETSKGRK